MILSDLERQCQLPYTHTYVCVCVGRGYVTYIAFVVAEVDAQHGHGANNGDQ